MTTNTVSTRRSFFSTAGAAMATPLALAGASAAAADADGTLALRLAALEDQHAIRSLAHDYLRRANAAASGELAALSVDAAHAEDRVRGVSADPFGASAVVEIAADRTSATLRMPCTVALEAPIEAPGCALVDMARQQGEGLLRRSEDQMLEQAFAKHGDAWKIASSELTRA